MAKRELEPVRDHVEAAVTRIKKMKGRRKLGLVMQGKKKTHLALDTKNISDCAPCPKKECDCSVPACDRPKVAFFLYERDIISS